jgi:putative two-component system response regulator
MGRNSIMAAEKLIESPNTFLHLAREIAWSHHEKWDGTGYPQGLSGDAIPIPGRLMAVVDVYDALVSKRVYKPAFPHTTAVSMIRESSGNHFDPDVVDAFFDAADQIREVAQRYLDAEGRES